MSREDPQMKIRLPVDLKERIEEVSKEDGRSMNAQIVVMLQAYFDRLDEQVAELRGFLDNVERSNISIGLTDPIDRAAVLKSLLLDELMLLRRRVAALGGPDAVLNMTKNEIVEKIEGPRIRGSTTEQKSLFSQMLPTYPLTALLTDGELDRLAERAIAMQQAASNSKK